MKRYFALRLDPRITSQKVNRLIEISQTKTTYGDPPLIGFVMYIKYTITYEFL